jgi:hypothetical protein
MDGLKRDTENRYRIGAYSEINAFKLLGNMSSAVDLYLQARARRPRDARHVHVVELQTLYAGRVVAAHVALGGGG